MCARFIKLVLLLKDYINEVLKLKSWQSIIYKLYS